jgi:hypothetical protein
MKYVKNEIKHKCKQRLKNTNTNESNNLKTFKKNTILFLNEVNRNQNLKK